MIDLYLYQREYKKAFAHLKVAYAADPEDVNVLLALGNCSIQLGEMSLSLMAFKKILKLHPETRGVRDMVCHLEKQQSGSFRDEGRSLI